MKRIVLFICALCLCSTVVCAACIVTDANACPTHNMGCGDFKYSLCDSILTLTGSGAITVDYWTTGSPGTLHSPWNPYWDMIKEIIVDGDITQIGGGDMFAATYSPTRALTTITMGKEGAPSPSMWINTFGDQPNLTKIVINGNTVASFVNAPRALNVFFRLSTLENITLVVPNDMVCAYYNDPTIDASLGNREIYRSMNIPQLLFDFDANGGSAGSETNRRMVPNNSCQLTNVPTAALALAGYTFDGWYTAPAAGSKVTNNIT